jgi:hypothetical protein
MRGHPKGNKGILSVQAKEGGVYACKAGHKNAD